LVKKTDKQNEMFDLFFVYQAIVLRYEVTYQMKNRKYITRTHTAKEKEIMEDNKQMQINC